MNAKTTGPGPTGAATAVVDDSHGARWMLPLVLVVALLCRVVCYAELAAGPCIDQHRWEESDMHYFDAWGRSIADGDWLSTRVTVPMHGWHADVAKEHLQRHPEARAELEKRLAATGPVDESRLVEATWLAWLGGRTFYQDPLYPYLIGLTYTVCGPNPHCVLVWQMLMGVGACLCAFLLARRWFGPTSGLLAGLIAAACPPLLCFELVLVRETTIVFLGSVLVLAIVRALERPTARRHALVGVLLGLAVLAKSTFVLFGIGLAAGLVLASRRRGEPLRNLAPAAIAFALVMLLPLVRNLAVGVAPLGLASSGALTFVMHNAVDYDASVGGFFVSKHAAKILGESGGAFFPSMSATLGTHTLGSWLQQVVAKAGSVFHWFEISDNTNFYVYRLHAAALWLPFSSWFVLSFGAVGVGLAAFGRRTGLVRPPLWPQHLLVATSLVALLGFLVTARIRLPFVAALIPFAALTLVTGFRWLRERRGKGGAIVLVAAVAAFAFVGRPLSSRASMYRGIDLALPSELAWTAPIRTALDANDLPAAKRAVDTALQEARQRVERAGPADVQNHAMVEGLLAYSFHQGPYAAAIDRAKATADWSRVAAILASFAETMPASVRALVERRPTDPATLPQLVAQARFYEQVFRDCAAAWQSAGARTEAAACTARADAIANLLRSHR